MNPAELRIGNWINTIEGFAQVKAVSDDGSLATSIMTGGDLLGWTTSIPLTEEWLFKFGFDYDTETKSWSLLTSLEKFDYLFEISNKYQEYFQPDFMALDIVYVHQLQNLYFALTGNELTAQ